MSRPRVILFTFAGRRPNMELQIPLVRRILNEHEDTRWDVWNLTRNLHDNLFVRSITGDRVTVHNQFRKRQRAKFHDVYRHYADPQYRDCVFVKLDDDIVFLQTDRFAQFTAAVGEHPGQVLSATVINNGATARTQPALWKGFQRLNIPLLDVHKHAEFAAMCHNQFLDDPGSFLEQEPGTAPTDDWLSINTIGYDWNTGCQLADNIGTPSPELIAGRRFTRKDLLGDEGTVNMLPRTIMQGFTAAHLSFGVQPLTVPQLAELRERYAELGRAYLGEKQPA